MSLNLEVVWEGLDGLRAYLERTLPQAFRESSEYAVDKAGDDGVDRMKQLVAVDTGDLRSTCRKRMEAYPGPPRVFQVALLAGGMRGKIAGKMVDYAWFVEHGTSRQRPQPFLRPALKWCYRRVPGYFWEALSRRVEVE